MKNKTFQKPVIQNQTYKHILIPVVRVGRTINERNSFVLILIHNNPKMTSGC